MSLAEAGQQIAKGVRHEIPNVKRLAPIGILFISLVAATACSSEAGQITADQFIEQLKNGTVQGCPDGSIVIGPGTNIRSYPQVPPDLGSNIISSVPQDQTWEITAPPIVQGEVVGYGKNIDKQGNKATAPWMVINNQGTPGYVALNNALVQFTIKGQCNIYNPSNMKVQPDSTGRNWFTRNKQNAAVAAGQVAQYKLNQMRSK